MFDPSNRMLARLVLNLHGILMTVQHVTNIMPQRCERFLIIETLYKSMSVPLIFPITQAEELDTKQGESVATSNPMCSSAVRWEPVGVCAAILPFVC